MGKQGSVYVLLFFWGFQSVEVSSFQLGIENISSLIFKKLCLSRPSSYRIGLITNQTGCDQKGNRTVDILLQSGFSITYILAPEHGFDGKHLAGHPVRDAVDSKTGIPIKSMYCQKSDGSDVGRLISSEIMQSIDLIFYDIQDVGMRHYTYISTLFYALKAAAEHDKPVVILDRPNFLGPYMEGPLVEPQQKSFIAVASIPLRHGMTVGELADYFNKHTLKQSVRLYVVPMKNYMRTIKLPLLSALSPNISSMASLYGYSFLGILGEVQPFYIGAGTLHSFQVIMLPESSHFSVKQWEEVRTILNDYGIYSTYYVEHRKNGHYNGLKLDIPNGKIIPSFSLLLSLLLYFKQSGVIKSYSAIFDKALGTNKVRKFLEQTYTKNELKKHVNENLNNFFVRAKSSFLYKPFPIIKKMK